MSYLDISYHAGAVGEDGGDLCALLESNQVNVQFLQNMPGASGHAIIQVTPQGQNCITISGGSNHRITREYIDNVLSHFNAGDWLLLQNETSEVAYAIKVAKRLGLRVALNPSPITEELLRYPLDMVDVFLFSNKGE